MNDFRSRIYNKYLDGKGQDLKKIKTSIIRKRPFFRNIIVNFFKFSKSSKVIDLGCGYGGFLMEMENEGFTNCIGIENSEQMFSAAQSITSVSIIKSDIMDYLKKLESNSVDCITAIDVIEHFTKEELLLLLDEIFRVLRTNGMIITHQPNGESPFSGVILYGDYTHHQCFTKSSILQIMGCVGFRDISSYEDRPFKSSVFGFLRFIIWITIIRPLYIFLNLVETGSGFNSIFSRNFITVAKKYNV